MSQEPKTSQPAEPARAVVSVTVSGPVGCGKSAVAGEIEIALKAIGVNVVWADPERARSEKNLTGADWATSLDLYKPTVVLQEVSRSNRPGSCPRADCIGMGFVVDRAVTFACGLIGCKHNHCP